MPTTSRGFRYPNGGDSPNVAQYIQNLANDVDSAWGTVGGIQSSTPQSVTMAGGWSVSVTFRCFYTGGRMVQLVGTVTNNSSYNPTSAAATVCTLPVGYRPAAPRTIVIGLYPGSPTTLLGTVLTTGQVQVAHSGNVTIPVTQSHYFDNASFFLD